MIYPAINLLFYKKYFFYFKIFFLNFNFPIFLYHKINNYNNFDINKINL